VLRGALPAADVELRAALAIDNALVGPDDWHTARAQASLAWSLIMRGDVAQGEPMLIAARNRLVATLGATAPETAWVSARLADYLRAHHRDAEAATVLASTHKG